jgi:ribose 5-phosphate isomerase A
MVLGLGSGSTAGLVLEELARRLADGRLRDVVGVPTSLATAELARALGVPLADLDERPVLDLTIDGADEVGPAGQLLKGGGGALVREKIVAAASRRLVIVVDESKQVDRIARRHPLPVAVTSFGWSTHLDAVRALGGEPALRRDAARRPYATDEGLYILDCRFPAGIAEPAAAAGTLKARPGVVETGLFLGFAPEVIVGRGR